MISLDATTLSSYLAASTADARAQAVIDSLTGTVYVRVYDGSNTLMGEGTMAAPWATRSGSVITVGEVTSFSVLNSGTPNAASWYLRFETAGGRWVRGPFGAGGNFTWSLGSTWNAGQSGSLGTVTLNAKGTIALAGAAIAQAAGSAGLTVSGGGELVFFDDFDYSLLRVDSSTTKRNLLATKGYTFYKDENYSAGSNGYIYTDDAVPGYGGTLPGSGPNVMAFESLGGTEGQTDYYVQLGDGADAASPASASIPPDIWFQFWMYVAGGTAPAGKWLYALPAAPGTRTSYPGTNTEMPWLTTISRATFEPAGVLANAPNADWYTFMTEVYANGDPPSSGRTDWPSDVRWKVGPNMVSGDARWLRPDRWYLHRMRFDTSGGGNRWEWWAREMGVMTFTKMAEYIHGVTANFSWPTQATHSNGFRYLRMPTTNSNDSFQYLRDFAIATSESALPSYGSY